MLATGPWFLHTYWLFQPQFSRAMWRAVENGTRDQRETDTSRTSRNGTWLSYKRNTRDSYGRKEVKLQATHSFADRRYKRLEGSVWLHSLTGQHCAAVKWTSTGSTGFHVEEVCAGNSPNIYAAVTLALEYLLEHACLWRQPSACLNLLKQWAVTLWYHCLLVWRCWHAFAKMSNMSKTPSKWISIRSPF